MRMRMRSNQESGDDKRGHGTDRMVEEYFNYMQEKVAGYSRVNVLDHDG